jgi:hypothetical protein
VTRQTPDPDILALKEQLAELKTTIQAQQQQTQQPSAPSAPNPPAMTFPSELATTIQEMMATMHQQQLQLISSLRAEIAELRNQHQPLSKACPSAQTSESHLSEASFATREDNDAAMDHES